MKNFPQLPLAGYAGEITGALKKFSRAVIQAEPGAGKTMLVPVIIREFVSNGLTILVEPRRIAARSAACGIAEMHGFVCGRETGFAVRGDRCNCQKDGILAVTPGILLQMLQNDPLLENISAVIFDEFHERSMENDLAAALIMDIHHSVRPDLVIAVMSATLNSTVLPGFFDAPLISVPGRSFPVAVSYREMSGDLREMPSNVARIIMENLHETDGHMLVFLPGIAEISMCRASLPELPENIHLHILCGSMDIEDQRTVIHPVEKGVRKIILATNVAESSITIDGVTSVIDSTWEKRLEYYPGAGKSFLETVRISKDSAIQRAGRAGRTAPGKAVRCCSKLIFDQMTEHIRPEILSADISPLLLAVRCWGSDISSLKWLDLPAASAVKAGYALLVQLGFLDKDLRPTAEGKTAVSLPLSPRTAAMMIFAPPCLRKQAAEFAAILEEKDDFKSFDTCDLRERVSAMYRNPSRYRVQRQTLSRLLEIFPPDKTPYCGTDDTALPVAAAFPDLIARRRPGSANTYQFVNGSAAVIGTDDFLCREEFLAVARADMSNSRANGVIRLAVPITKDSIEEFFADRIEEKRFTFFDAETEKIVSNTERRLGEMSLSKRSSPIDKDEAIRILIKEALRREIVLPPAENKRAYALMQRINFAGNCTMDEFPAKEELLDAVIPFFEEKITTLNELKKADWFNLLRNAAGYAAISELDRLYPEFFTAPTGMRFPVDYSGEQPSLSIQVQQMYGVSEHPSVGKRKIPLRINLLSPAQRPVQITCDLPGFWHGTWQLVRAEMKSRYPKHEWPEDPASALPMSRSVKLKKDR